MESGDLLRMARLRAGITQEQLGVRTGHHRTMIARWESGTGRFPLETLRELIEACDLDLVVHIAPRDQSLDELSEEQLGLSPLERLGRLVSADDRRQALWALRWVARGRAPAIVIGALAGVLQGAPQRPPDVRVEIMSSDPWVTEADLRETGFEAIDDEGRWATTNRRATWTLADRATVVLVSDPPGAKGYADLHRDSEMLEIDARTSVEVAHPRDLLRLGEASRDDSERALVPGLRALLAQRRTRAKA